MKKLISVICVLTVLFSVSLAEARSRRSVQKVVVNNHCVDHGQIAIREQIVFRDVDRVVEFVEVPHTQVVRKEYIINEPVVEKVVVKERQQVKAQRVRKEKIVEKNRAPRKEKSVKVERVVTGY